MVWTWTEFPSPRGSFIGKVPVPTAEPTDGELVTVCFAREWLPYVLGACSQLMLQSTWDSDDPAEVQLAQQRADRLIQYMALEACEASGDTPTPYWDEETTADDEAPPDEQTWYGSFFEGEFHEVLENWIIAGFVAYAATPAAAIFFLTVAPKFRLAFKTGNIGGIIRVFIDAADYGTVDTFSETAGIIEQDFVADPELEEHEVILVLEELHEE